MRVLIVTYACSEIREADARLSREHAELRWFPLAEVRALRMPEGYKASIAAWAGELWARGMTRKPRIRLHPLAMAVAAVAPGWYLFHWNEL